MQTGVAHLKRWFKGKGMELIELSAAALTEIYDRYMTSDFPKDELKPLERILYTMETGLCCAYGMYEQDELRGYAIFIVPDGLRYGLLDYLAVLKEYRGMGVGHAFFEQVGEVLATRYPALNGFYIESENVASAADEGERQTREKRIAFYRQNHCVMTTLESRLFGVDYSILLYDLDGKNTVSASVKDLDGIYRAMFKEHHYENAVSVWDGAHG